MFEKQGIGFVTSGLWNACLPGENTWSYDSDYKRSAFHSRCWVVWDWTKQVNTGLNVDLSRRLTSILSFVNIDSVIENIQELVPMECFRRMNNEPATLKLNWF